MTALPEDAIMGYLDFLLTSSESGAELHHMIVAAAPPGAIGPLGLPDEKKLEVALYAIAPDETVDVEGFIAVTIAGAAVEADRKGLTVLFAALSQEAWTAPGDELGRHLSRERRLSEHPAAAEVTMIYGASRDGRRWRGRRWLTGPKAGTTENVDMLVGQPQPGEAQGIPAAPLLRRLAGIKATP